MVMKKKMKACDVCASSFEIHVFLEKEKTFLSKRTKRYFYVYSFSACFCMIFFAFCA